jgi:hypothetical protein
VCSILIATAWRPHPATAEAYPRLVPIPTAITRGGIKIERDAVGNLTIHARGNGYCRVQRADIPDLQAVLDELEHTEVQGADGSKPTTRESRDGE